VNESSPRADGGHSRESVATTNAEQQRTANRRHDRDELPSVRGKRKTRRAYGVPEIRGTLKIYRYGELIEEITATAADRAAREIIRKTQGRGRRGRDM
jgi:hypothetical protein